MNMRTEMMLLRSTVMALIISQGTFSAPTLPPGGSLFHYVSPTGNHISPFASWESAATNIQSAVDVASDGHFVYVTNGIYLLSAEILVTNDISIKSMNGKDVTVIDGNDSVRCLNLGNYNCVVDGFEITRGYCTNEGGGIVCSGNNPKIHNSLIISNRVIERGEGNVGTCGGGVFKGSLENCTIKDNQVSSFSYERGSTAEGGGAHGSEINRCIIVGNKVAVFGADYLASYTRGVGGGLSACFVTNSLILNNECHVAGTGTVYAHGGGGSDGSFVNCTFVSNGMYVVSRSHYRHVSAGGGLYGGTAENCVFWRNAVGISGPTCHSCGRDQARYPNLYAAAENCCAYDGIGGEDGIVGLVNGLNGNIVQAPEFVDSSNGNFHLLPSSPCINWGNNAYICSLMDLGGSNRIVEGYVDIGCYEHQGLLGLYDGDRDGLPDEWERQHFSGNASPYYDEDGDGHANWMERVSGMDPSMSGSVFSITNNCSAGSFVIEWPSVSNRFYHIYWCTNLMGGFCLLDTDIEFPRSSYTDTVNHVSDEVFYKIGVSMSPYGSAVPLNMVELPAGINSGVNPDPDLGAYSLRLPDSLLMDKTEVSWELWAEVRDWALTNGYTFHPGGRKAPGHPVHSVNWDDCAKWCNARSEMSGRTPCYTLSGNIFRVGNNEDEGFKVATDYAANGFRLPTSVEWEYAARGGLQGKRFPWGDVITHDDANYRSTGTHSYDQSPTFDYHPDWDDGVIPLSAPCGTFPENGYGLQEMAGNIWEWCNDGSVYYKHITIGGGYEEPKWLRCGTAGESSCWTRYHALGLRTVCRP